MPYIKFNIITLFPEAIKPYLDSSMLFKAQKQGIIAIDYVNLRDFGLGPHKSVDDTPYGGGDGMLLRPEPVFAAIETVKSKNPNTVVFLPTPSGELWTQSLARKFASSAVAALDSSLAPSIGIDPAEFQQDTDVSSQPDSPETPPLCITILCPHYEGFDERIMSLVDHPISLGEYILTGGELPALIIIDSITRLLPGVLGGATSAEIESFSSGDNLEYPQYTKPADFRGMKVPEVLLSGHHANIAAWRDEQSRIRTAARRNLNSSQN